MEEKKPILYLNMILKDNEPVEIVKRSIDSVKDFVDGIYITVTYTDKEPTSSSLVTLLQEYKANVSYFKWVKRFSLARQFALDQIPKGENIFMYWQDADDILRGGEQLKLIVEDMERYQQTAVYLRYWYMVQLDKNGDVREVIIEHKRERIIRNDGTWKWIGDLHETLIEQRHDNLFRVYRKEALVIHLSTRERGEDALERNIEILENQIIREKGKDPRTLVYLGKAYFDKGRTVEDKKRNEYLNRALPLFHKYLEGEGIPGTENYTEASGWREERATAWANVGEIAILQNRPDIAVQAFQEAIEEAYEFPKYYVDLAMAYTMIKDYKRARHWLSVGTGVEMPETTIITFPKELKTRALQVALDINMNENKLEQALENAKLLVELSPEDKSNQENLETINKLITFNRACQSVVFLGKFLEKTGKKEELVNLVKAIPDMMQQEKFAIEMKHAFLPKKVWADNEIAIICGPGFEKWSPKSIESGVGGSEEAVIRMSEYLAKLGWKVTVYADPREDAGEYGGVTYRSWYEINPKDSFNVLILWRSVGFIDIDPQAKFILLWLHDVPNNPEFTRKRIDKIDKIAVLSEYHKSLLRMDDNGKFVEMPARKVLVTANGIMPLDLEWKGNPHRLIYMSSPDRGLPYLLKNWSLIKKEVPDAELHIFYGFNVFDAIYKGNPAKMKWKNDLLVMMQQKDIVYHDRVGHNALNMEIAKSGIWAYPTDFQEISCISAMRSQALGAVPVVTDYAALTETVKNGLRVDVDIRTDEGQKEYFKVLIDLMKNTKRQEEIRKSMIPWAREYFLWKNVAAVWDEIFRIQVQHPERKFQVDEGVKTNAIRRTKIKKG